MANRGKVADRFWTRFRGLLGRRQFHPGEALIIKPCSSVHMIGMKFPISVLFVSPQNKILHIIEVLRPYQLSPLIKGSAYVVELPVGQVEASGTKVGDGISIQNA